MSSEDKIEQLTDWMPATEAAPTPFAEAVDHVLKLTAELARELIGAHQAAAALIVKGDWKTMHKHFSMSPKYEKWFEYRTPATGFGIHALPVTKNQPVRFTQAELEAHLEWKGFGVEASNHPPMRGWLAVPLIGADGLNYGLLQLSDKNDESDFTEEDERRLSQLAELTATTLDALRRLHDDDSLGHRE